MNKLAWLCALSSSLSAQADRQMVQPVERKVQANIPAEVKPGTMPANDQPVQGSYILGPGDEMAIRALDVEEFGNIPVRLDMEGNIRLPLIGRVHAAGLTVEELEAAVKQRLKVYVVDPDVIVTVSSFRSQPVIVLGAVAQPGVHQLEGRKTLFEVISEVGGMRPDAGYAIKLTRQKQWGPIPLPSCIEDQTGQFYVAQVSVRSVMEAKDPQENVLIRPNDVITVPKGQIVYVIGAVKKSGGYVLGDSESMTVVQALALADGLDAFAATNRARIMRVTPGSTKRTEIPVDVKKMFEGKGNDVALRGDDILFIPVSASKKATTQAVEASIGLASGVALYRLGR